MNNGRRTATLIALGLAVTMSGCAKRRAGSFYAQPAPPAPLGTISDPIWQTQEVNAEAAKFIVYDHEFKLNGVRLNLAGQDHVKQIAAELQRGAEFPVVVERSMTSEIEGTRYNKHKLPVNENPELDLKRREVIVRALTAMGIDDAEQRVVVAPDFSQGLTGGEAEQAYGRGISQNNLNGNYGGGFGGFGGGGGGFGGGIGGFGGGF
jgi:hypothetical protein